MKYFIMNIYLCHTNNIVNNLNYLYIGMLAPKWQQQINECYSYNNLLLDPVLQLYMSPFYAECSNYILAEL